MSRQVRWAVSLFFVAAAAACDCGGTKFDTRGNTTLTIDKPATGDTFTTLDTVDVQATANNPVGLSQVVLSVGKMPLQTCPVGDEGVKIECTAQFNVKDFASEITNGQLVIAAVAADTRDNLARQSVTIDVRTLRVRFIAPVPDDSDPPHANVSGASKTVVEVLSASALSRVAISYDDGTDHAGRLINWNGDEGTAGQDGALVFTSPTSIQWAAAIGTGTHQLLAQAQDVNGNVESAQLEVDVSCKKDADCPSDYRCCAQKGTCNPIVDPGADCDCEHPCPTSQGCFPGTCGETPAKCRPGCYPGDQNTKADRCSPTSTGVVTYCSTLPANQRTDENEGGACAPGDNCSVTQQNCPDLPLDRTHPVSANNPAVPHTCVPVSPYATACRPAGAKKLGQQNCEYDTCGDSSAGCAKGLICTGLVDDPTAPTTCNKQCSNPSDFPVPSSECGGGSYCTSLYGAGLEKVKTGVCQ